MKAATRTSSATVALTAGVDERKPTRWELAAQRRKKRMTLLSRAWAVVWFGIEIAFLANTHRDELRGADAWIWLNRIWLFLNAFETLVRFAISAWTAHVNVMPKKAAGTVPMQRVLNGLRDDPSWWHTILDIATLGVLFAGSEQGWPIVQGLAADPSGDVPPNFGFLLATTQFSSAILLFGRAPRFLYELPWLYRPLTALVTRRLVAVVLPIVAWILVLASLALAFWGACDVGAVPQLFGTLGLSMLTVLQLMTLDRWRTVLDELNAIDGDAGCAAPWVGHLWVYVVLALFGFVAWNLVTALCVDAVVQASRRDDAPAAAAESPSETKAAGGVELDPHALNAQLVEVRSAIVRHDGPAMMKAVEAMESMVMDSIVAIEDAMEPPAAEVRADEVELSAIAEDMPPLEDDTDDDEEEEGSNVGLTT